MKIGVNAVMVTDVISPLVGEDGWPLLTAKEGDKVFVVCSSPLMVQKAVSGVVFSVKEDWIRTVRGRPHSID